MEYRLIALILNFILCFVPSMYAQDLIISSFYVQESQPDILARPILDLNNLVQKVIDRNPDLAAARSRIKAASFVIPRVKTLDDPEFTFVTMNNRFGCKNEFMPERRYRFSQKIPFPGKLSTKGKIAKYELEFVESEKITTHHELILQAKKLYFRLYLNRISIDINEQNRTIVTRLMQGALAVYKTGRANQADALKAHIELQILDDELLTLESERSSLIAMINAILDREQQAPLGEPKVTFFSDINLQYDQLEDIAMRSRPELSGLQAMVDEQDARAKLARLEYFPDFTFEFMLQDHPKTNKTAWGLSVGLNVPIWIGQKQSKEVQEAESRAQANTSALQGFRAMIRGRIKELLAQIKATQERIVLFESGLLKKTATTLASNEAQYRVGKGDFLTVLDTRRQLQDFELDYERARIEREILLAELERATGISIEKITPLSTISLKHPNVLSKNMSAHKTKSMK